MINTLYTAMRRYPVCFLLSLYYDATLPMLDWYRHHHFICHTIPSGCVNPCFPLLSFYIHTIPCSLVPVTINTLYALKRWYPVCFSPLLYYDATLPMLDWYGHHHSITTTTSCITPVWPWLLFYLHTIPCSLVLDTSHLYSLIRYALCPTMYINPCTK